MAAGRGTSICPDCGGSKQPDSRHCRKCAGAHLRGPRGDHAYWPVSLINVPRGCLCCALGLFGKHGVGHVGLRS